MNVTMKQKTSINNFFVSDGQKADRPKHTFLYRWTLKDAVFTKDKGTVFSCFACGGGSTMGYKLAGFDVIGCNEIDPKMIEAYKANHNPKFAYLEPIQTFKLREDLPDELYHLDILDGSPPCSSFSMAGNRESDWGKEKVFREGQAEQVLDTLFFDFIDLAKKLQPKVVIAENVKGLMLGEAKQYVRKIYAAFQDAGYQLRITPYLLDASKMGVPQKRERVFFVALRNDLAGQFMEQIDMFQSAPKLDLNFDEPEIKYGELADYEGDLISDHVMKAWECRAPGDLSIADSKERAGMKVSDMNTGYVFEDKVCQTLTAKGRYGSLLFSKPIRLSKNEFCKIGSYPLDYNFNGNPWGYVIGMSVPPLMTAQIATRVYTQWLAALKGEEKNY
jgi:DNA (cytosine-5)-methyltransferase 1